jgi:hypothetical protein
VTAFTVGYTDLRQDACEAKRETVRAIAWPAFRAEGDGGEPRSTLIERKHPMAQKPMNATNQALAATYANPESPAEQAILAALENGRKVLGDTAKFGGDQYSKFTEFRPDGSVRTGWQVVHPDGSKDTHVRELDTVHFGVQLGWLDTHTEHGVETVVNVYENVPGSIGLAVGQSHSAPEDKSSAAGLVPNSWDPKHDGNSGATSGGPGSTDTHDPGFSTGPVFGSGGNGGTKTTTASATSSQHACGEHTDCNTGGAWEPGASHQSIAGTTQVTGEDDQGELRAFGSASEFDQSSSGTAGSAGSSSVGSAGSVADGDKPDDGHKGDSNNSDGHHDGDGNDDHDDNKDNTKEETSTTDEKGDMPNPEGGPGNPNSTPNPEGDGDDGENGHHGPTLNQGSNVGHLSTQLAAVGNSQDGAASDGYHGPHDPGEEMPNPDDTGGGNPISNVAHGATSFWDQVASATQGTTQGASGATLSTAAVTAHAGEGQLAFSAATTSIAHDATSHDVSDAHADA